MSVIPAAKAMSVIPAAIGGASVYPVTRSVLGRLVLIGLLSFLPSVLIIAAANRYGPAEDGGWYLDAAQSLASGQGYQNPEGPWPGKPTTWHPPLWPFVESLAIRCLPSVHPASASHIAGLWMHGVTVLAVAVLTWTLSGSLMATFCASLLIGLWPSVLVAIAAGDSEPCASAVIAGGTALIVAEDGWAGVCVLSLMPLVRPNFLLFPFSAALALAISGYRVSRFSAVLPGRRLFLAAILFCVPAVAWMVRNDVEMHASPLLAADEGASFYGSWNPLSTAAGQRFALWVHPSNMPGEEKMESLAKRMTEPELNWYYHLRGSRFLLRHIQLVPAMMAGHFVRAFLPQRSAAPRPLKFIWRVPEWICRFGLYAAAAVLFFRRGSRAQGSLVFNALLGATAMTVLATVLLFFGEQRYMYPLTALLVVYLCSRWPRLSHGDERS
jgi:hypothetical protein